MTRAQSSVEIVRTKALADWLGTLRDRAARARIEARLVRLADGNIGDAAPVGEGVSELRIHHGPGYGVYFVQRGRVLIVLLCGGDKGSQARDIATAKGMARML